MPSTRSVNHCSPPPLQPLLSLRFTSCAAGKRGAGGAVPHTLHPLRRDRGTATLLGRAHPSPALAGPR